VVQVSKQGLGGVRDQVAALVPVKNRCLAQAIAAVSGAVTAHGRLATLLAEISELSTEQGVA